MKKRLITILLTLWLAVLSALPAMAADKSGSYYYYLSMKEGELWYRRAPYMQKFWDEGEFPWGVGPLNNGGVLYGISYESCNLPHQGLVLVEHYIKDSNGSSRWEYDYVTYENHKVPIYGIYEHILANLNQGRFEEMFDFSDDAYGLAAAVNDYWQDGEFHKQQYYVDTAGVVAITLPLEVSPIRYDSQYYTGRFVDGKAIVFKDSPATDSLLEKYTGNDLDTRTLTYAYINMKGEMVTDWQTASTDAQYKEIFTSVYNSHGIRLVDVLYSDGYQAPAEPTGPVEPGEGTTEPEEKPEEKPEVETTYGQSQVKIKGYTIENGDGFLLVDVVNNTKNPDEGDCFYLQYDKYKEMGGLVDSNTEFLPGNDWIMSIHYSAQAGEQKTLRIPVGTIPGGWGVDVTDADKEAGWTELDYIADSRVILAQAETKEEFEELTEFFKGMHYYNEVQRDFQMDENGVTYLAVPASTLDYRHKLDQKLSAFTNRF